MQQVARTLEEMGLKDRPLQVVFNKLDKVEYTAEIERAKAEHPDAEFISALRGIGIDTLKKRLRNAKQKWLMETRVQNKQADAGL